MSYNNNQDDYESSRRDYHDEAEQRAGRGGRDEYSSSGNRDDYSSGGGYNQGGYSQGGQDGRQGGYNQGGQDGRQGGYGQDQGYGSGNSGTSYGGGGAYGGGNDSFDGAQHAAAQHAGDSGDSNMFSNAISHLQGNRHNIQNQDVDEEDAVRQHQNMYGGGGGGQAGSGAMGSAAAMQALKMFGQGGGGGGGGGSGGIGGMISSVMGGGGQQQQHGSSGVGGMLSSIMGGGGSSGGSQNQFVGLAMGEASKLFDQQSASGNVAPGTNKQSVVNSAAEQALKFYMKSEMGGGGGGLMSLASKFM